MDRSRLRVFLILIVIILLLPSGNSPTSSEESGGIIVREKQLLQILRQSTYGVPGNLTGINFTHGVIPPEPVRELARSLKQGALGDYLGKGRASNGSPSTRKDSEGGTQGDGGKEVPKGEAPVGEEVEAKKLNTGGIRSSWESAFILDHQLSLYRNATGTIHGRWSRLQMPGLDIPLTNLTYEKNVTADHGKIVFTIEEKKKAGEVQEVAMTLVIKNEDGGDMKDINLNGVHFTRTGEMFLTTTSDSFAGIFALPHFTLTQSAYIKSKTLLLESISSAIRKQEGGSSNGPWQYSSGEMAGGNPYCEYIVYFQLHPVQPSAPSSPLTFNPDTFYQPPISPETLDRIEEQLRRPTGAPVPDAPPIVASSIIYSPTCGYVLGIERAEGVKVEKYYSRAANFALGTATATCIQMWLLVRQMKESSTPSTISRISFWTMAMLSVVDSYITLVFLTVAIFIEKCFLVFLAATFLLFLSVSVFGVRFLKIIYQVQRPERRSSQPTPPQATPAVVDTSSTDPPTPPITSPLAPVVIPPNRNTNVVGDDGRQDISMLYSRFTFVLLGAIFLSIHAMSWPPLLRNIFVYTAVILANGFWVPQIYRNLMRGCRKALSWEFVAGTSICRLLGVIYAYCWRGNIFDIEPDWRAAVIMIGWVWFQVCLLASQQMFGPRFLIPPNLLPPAYDYHPVLPVGDLEAGDSQIPPSFPPTDGTALLPSNMRLFDCAICMQSVEVPTLPNDRQEGGGSSSVSFLGRWNYMVTPCRHVFHSRCLEGWMKFRLQCPICRNPLPPL